MSGWLVVTLAVGGWCLLAVLLALALGYAVRSNTQTPAEPANAPHTPAWARQKTRSRR